MVTISFYKVGGVGAGLALGGQGDFYLSIRSAGTASCTNREDPAGCWCWRPTGSVGNAVLTSSQAALEADSLGVIWAIAEPGIWGITPRSFDAIGASLRRPRRSHLAFAQAPQSGHS